MTLTQRLVVGALTIVGVVTLVVVATVERRLQAQLTAAATERVLREARLVAEQWRPALSPDSLADAAAQVLGLRVSLLSPMGTPIGDSDLDSQGLSTSLNEWDAPDMRAARDSGTAVRVHGSATSGAKGEVVTAVVRANQGFVRVTSEVAALRPLVAEASRAAYVAAGAAGAVIALIVFGLARSVVYPIRTLRDDAKAIAAGDVARRPTLAGPGEVGELATAFHRVAEVLGSRLAALEADDALLRALMESLNEGVVAIDEQDRVVHLNSQAQQLLDARDRVPFHTDRLPRAPGLRHAIQHATRGALIDELEIHLNGRTVALTARPLSAGGTVLTLFDLTLIRRLESVRRDFVANVSHELRTPITVVAGFAETLLDDSLPDEQRRQFTLAMLAHSRRMQRIVDDLLDLSRIESGGWSPNPAPTDLATVVAELTVGVRDAAERRGVRVIDDIADSAPTVDADPTAVRQILGNLIDNALRHTTQGEVSIFSRPREDGVVIGVRDTGSGIPAEHLPRIFERFYRVDAARSRQEGGTGLGLSIVKHLVEAHGGRVWAESATGAGTTVAAFFPARKLSVG